MKTKRNLITLIAVAFVTLASAVEQPKMYVQPLSTKQAIVSFLNNNASNYEISIRAKNGDIVYYKQSNKPVSSYKKIFNMKNLENGDYKLKLDVDGTNLERDFTITTKKIYYGESKLYVDRYFVFDGKELKFSYLNFEKERFKMEIFDENELIFKANMSKDYPIHSGYNLSNLKAGNYKVVFSSLNNIFVYQCEK